MKSYLTTERDKTKPANHIYAATPQWFAVHTTNFFAKVRPGHGIHSAEGVRTCFIEQDLLYGTGRNDLKLPFLVRMPDGTERYEDNQRLVFVRADYLLDIRPTLVDEVGEIHFLARDENLVSQFCPHFHRYIKEWPASVTGEVTGNATSQVENAPPEPAVEPKPGAQSKGKKTVQSVKPKSSRERPNQPMLSPAQPTAAEAPPPSQAPEPEPKQLIKTEQINWAERFEKLLNNFTLDDTAPENGWIFLTPTACYLRHPAFFKAILPLESVDERRAILQALQAAGFSPAPYEGDIECLQPGGKVKLNGSFIKVTLSGPHQVALIMTINAPNKTAAAV